MAVHPRFPWLAWLALPLALAGQVPRSAEYAAVQDRLAQGWNTWDVASVGAQVLLPDGFSLRVGLGHRSALYQDAFRGALQVGLRGANDEDVTPGPHTWNGSFTEFRVSWHGHDLLLQTAHDGDDLVMLATPAPSEAAGPPTLVVSAGILWGRPGAIARVDDHLEFSNARHRVPVFWTGTEQPPGFLPVTTPYFACPLAGPVGVSTGRPRSLAEIRAILGRQRPPGTGAAQAIESVMGWDTTYDPARARVISPVSRPWSTGWGGYVLFEWDTFFAATLAAAGDRDLAYANALEILNEAAPSGLIPNFARPDGWRSADRSEPPVGAITVLALYRQFHDAWFLRDALGPLLTWNRWWDAHRQVDGYLVLGTDAGNRPRDPDDPAVGTLQGAKYESGLDNSPMYDGAGFDPATGRMRLADVGMTSLYIADCNALAEVADILGRAAEAAELRGRGARYGARLQTLWDEKTGMFLNRDLDSGKPSPRLSPTNFYPLLAGVATPAQADRMVRGHLLNPAEFGGPWVIPSISRSDPAFHDQEYWRGRIWGPMNYLVYLGLCHYDQPAARRQLAAKSLALFNQEWVSKGHVHENYNAVTGSGDDVASSDRFYLWGALLGLIDLTENGPAPMPAGTAAVRK
jgi:putative isomerase